MTDPVADILALWGLPDAQHSFVAGRENRVYRVETAAGTYALRLKRPGYRGFDALQSELDWLAGMAQAGLCVPTPKPTLSGDLIAEHNGQFADLVTWLSGTPMGQSRVPLTLPDAPATFHMLGQTMAQLHSDCDAWTPPTGFTRGHWDAEGLLGDSPLWGRFWDNPTLDADTRALFLTFRDEARIALEVLDLDYGLIHADLVRENVLLKGDRLQLIDFDDGGFGFRLFDIATTLLKNRMEPDYPALKSALIAGYHSIRPLDLSALDLFLALRAVTYVGWITPRMAEEGAPARNIRFIAEAKTLCTAYLAQSHAA